MVTQTKEIIWNVVNSLLAGALVFLGSVTTGQITVQGALLSIATAFAAACLQFKGYWDSQKGEYTHKVMLFKFI